MRFANGHGSCGKETRSYLLIVTIVSYNMKLLARFLVPVSSYFKVHIKSAEHDSNTTEIPSCKNEETSN